MTRDGGNTYAITPTGLINGADMTPDGDKPEDWRSTASDGPPPWYFFVLAILTVIIAAGLWVLWKWF
jgi:hypothetical protein